MITICMVALGLVMINMGKLSMPIVSPVLLAQDHSSALPPLGFGLHQGGGVPGRTTKSNTNAGIPLSTMAFPCVGTVCAMATTPLVTCLLLFDGNIKHKRKGQRRFQTLHFGLSSPYTCLIILCSMLLVLRHELFLFATS